MKKIVFIPSIKKNNGTGHLKRTISWAKSALYESYIYIPENINSDYNCDRIDFSSFPGIKEIDKSIIHDLSEKYDIAVFDMRKTDPRLIQEVKKAANILISVDEGGTGREIFDYLIDTLPNTVSKKEPSNIFSTDLLGYADRRNMAGCAAKSALPKKYSNILISFGGEDSAGITEKFLAKAQKENLFKDINVTIIIGPFFKNKNYIKNNFAFYNIIESPASLSNLIEESDFVFTSFGLTAYEALYAGKDIILINPAHYHRKLSRLACFCEAGIINPDIKKIKKIMENPFLYNSICSKKLSDSHILKNENFTPKIDELFLKIAETEKIFCPVCKGEGKIYKRYIYKNYLKCKTCGIVYLQNIGKSEKKYDKSYFFEEYKKQYGRTYIEDFSNISANSQKRADIIKKFIKQGTILDIGCAYGPFLHVMKDSYKCYGIDISEDAVEYVKNKLGIDAITGDFSAFNCSNFPVFEKAKSALKFDIITMWYVIEHFKNAGEVIEKAGRLIKKSGMFAFSTPNLSGISGIYNKNKFLESSPDDHYTVWNILSAKHILSQFGFKVVKVKCTGHHPERFPLILQKILGFKILGFISRFLRLGDTFEIYAIHK